MTYIPDNYSECSNRLPCGVCRLTNQICPINTTIIKPMWTCNTGTDTGFQKDNEEKV